MAAASWAAVSAAIVKALLTVGAKRPCLPYEASLVDVVFLIR